MSDRRAGSGIKIVSTAEAAGTLFASFAKGRQACRDV
jgi:hypothetical protein